MDQNIVGLGELVDYFPTGQLTEQQKNEINGRKVKIENITTKTVKSRYGADGKELPNEQTVEVPVVVCETEPVTKDANGNDVRISERFPLKHVNGKWGVSHHSKSKSAKLFAILGINRFEQAKGREILLVKKVNPENPTKSWIGFAI